MLRQNGWSDAAMPELLELFVDAHDAYSDDQTSVFLSVPVAEGSFKANHGIHWCGGERR
jgi:hypothetical protein